MLQQQKNSLLNYHDYQIKIVNPLSILTGLTEKHEVHILASGNSIMQVNMESISQQPTIFVNGSIQLFEQYKFDCPVAYVITDKRFIEHNLPLMQDYYQGQCSLFITQAVLENLYKFAPKFLEKIHANIYLIYNYQKPIQTKTSSLLNKLTRKIKPPQTPPDCIKIKANSYKPVIGVSTDIRYGFVEAGTVAFVATQLAYSMGFQQIYLHGMDLLNSNQPRFYENQTNQAPCKLDKAVANRIVPCFDFLASIYHTQGVIVYNSSPISKNLFQHLVFQADYLHS